MDYEIQMRLIQAAVDEAKHICMHTAIPSVARKQVTARFMETAGEFERFGVPAEEFANMVMRHVEANQYFMWAVFGQGDMPK